MILENKEYDVKNRITCDCGYEFTLQDMERLTRINQSGFYGNVVKHYSHAKCKQCGKDVILLLKQVGQTYKIIDIAIENVININNNTIENVKTDTGRSNIGIDGKNNSSQEFICPECKKVCKSQIGLNSHLKTHQN